MDADVIEISERVLAELEEAQEENIYGLMNTVIQATGAEAERGIYAAALVRLIEFGDVALARESSGRPLKEMSAADSALEARRATAAMKFEPSKRGWIDPTDAYEIYAVLLPPGLERSVKLLEERGYQWWRQL